MKLAHLLISPILACLFLHPAFTASFEPISPGEEKRLFNLVRSHKCEDGKTVAQILSVAKTATRGGFIPRGFDLGWDYQGKLVNVYAEYVRGDAPQPGNEYNIGWKLTKNRTAVEPDSVDATVMELGLVPFLYYINHDLKDNEVIHNPAYLKKFDWLSILSARGYRNGIAGLVASKGIKVTDVQINPIAVAPQAIEIRVYFSRFGYSDLHADWIKGGYKNHFAQYLDGQKKWQITKCHKPPLSIRSSNNALARIVDV